MSTRFKPGLRERSSGWEKSIPRGGPVATTMDPLTVSRLSPAEARDWYRQSIETTYKNMDRNDRRRMQKAARQMFKRIGRAAMRAALNNASIPGKLLSLLLDGLAELADRYPWRDPSTIPAPLARTRRTDWSVNGVRYGVGHAYWSLSSTPLSTYLDKTEPNVWPNDIWTQVQTTGWIHQYYPGFPRSSVFESYSFFKSIPASSVRPQLAPLTRGEWLPNPKGYRRAAVEPLPTPYAPPPFRLDVGGNKVKVGSPKAGSPPRGVREGKPGHRASRVVMAVKEVLGAATEAMDFLTVLYAASGGFDEKRGHFSFEDKVHWLFFEDGIENFDWRRFVAYMAIEQAQDALIGAYSKKTVDSFIAAGWSSAVGPTSGPAL